MSPLYFIYRQLTTAVFFVGFPLVKLFSMVSRRIPEGMDQRFGFYSRQVAKTGRGPRIWMHAASVGEVSVAAAIAEEIWRCAPDAALVVSTTTRTGKMFGRGHLPPSIPLMYCPVDCATAVRRALSAVRPDVLACIETEIWPNLFVEAKRCGIKTVLVNGRISPRSFRRYRKIRALTRPVLETVAWFGMIHEEDARRIRTMGAPDERVRVLGNAKVDGLIRNHYRIDLAALRRVYSLTGGEAVVVAGSTRQNEEGVVAQAFREVLETFPEAVLLMAPRHIERSRTVSDLLASQGLRHQLRSEFDGTTSRRTENVVIVDTIGELAGLYGLSRVAFCGGSLVPLGGQNILEAAVWGTPVCYGPFMEDFQEARELIEAAAEKDFVVRSKGEMAGKIIFYLNNPQQRETDGRKIRSAVLSHQGAARRHAQALLAALEHKRGDA